MKELIRLMWLNFKGWMEIQWLRWRCFTLDVRYEIIALLIAYEEWKIKRQERKS